MEPEAEVIELHLAFIWETFADAEPDSPELIHGALQMLEHLPLKSSDLLYSSGMTRLDRQFEDR